MTIGKSDSIAVYYEFLRSRVFTLWRSLEVSVVSCLEKQIL